MTSLMMLVLLFLLLLLLSSSSSSLSLFLSTFTRVNVRTMMTAAGAFNNVEQKKKMKIIKKN